MIDAHTAAPQRSAMIRAFLLSLGQLTDPAILRVLAKVLIWAALLFAVLGVTLWQIGERLAAAYGYADTGWAAAGAVLVSVLLAWLLFRVIAIALTGLFADAVVEVVEQRHYPQALADARAPSIALAARLGLASALRAIFFNLLALPVYLLLLVTGIGTIAVFAIVNALLLGRDLGEMVAIRHMPPEAVRGWLAATRARRFTLGLAVTGLFVIPVVNLLAPILGAAMATHMFHKGRT